MGKSMLIFVLVFPVIAFCQNESEIQEKVTLQNGRVIKLNYKDFTWKYLDEKTIKESLFEKSNYEMVVENEFIANTANIKQFSGLTTINKKPFGIREVLKDFPVNEDFFIVGYVNQHLQVKSQNGIIGYIPMLFSINDYRIDNKKTEIIKEEIFNVKHQKNKILIKGAFVNEINSVGGVDFSIEWGYFDESKIIKYIYFTVVPYNAVGDIVRCEIGNHSTFTGQITGPINAMNDFETSYWSTAWYNNTVNCIEITKVEIKYMDGSSYTYINELPKIITNKYILPCN